jgi:uncharacterized protein (TIGR03083 family)
MTAEAVSALRQATELFVSTVERVQPGQWDQPALGQWSVRDLVGHTGRAFQTVETYLDRPAEAVTIESGAEYIRASVSIPGIHDQVAQRGREAGQALGPEPLDFIRTLADRVLLRVDQADPEQAIAVLAGGMRLRDYVLTRTFELVVHTLDLASAIGAPVQLPPEAGRIALDLAISVALQSGEGAAVLRALTGRRPLPAGFSVV